MVLQNAGAIIPDYGVINQNIITRIFKGLTFSGTFPVFFRTD